MASTLVHWKRIRRPENDWIAAKKMEELSEQMGGAVEEEEKKKEEA
jgi:hypothetical protein